MLTTKSFGAKILLFGEYSVIRQSKALALPYDLFEGKLLFPKDKERNVDSELKAFSDYIKSLKEKKELLFDFDEKSFSFDVSGGIIFDSSIPQGYGAGSSGALCAAVFDQYCQIEPAKKADIGFLKECFSLLESHFHGSSSGVDPLISYLNSPILIGNNRELTKVQIPKFDSGKGGLFLLDTGRSRRTEPLVNLFLEKCSSKSFSYLCDRVLTPITNNCVDYFLNAQIDELAISFKELSQFQFEHFAPMIPKLYIDLWQRSLASKNFSLKLCGAGGGGFILGMTKDFSKLSDELQNKEVRPLLYF